MGSSPSTPLRFALGLVQLGLGFAALWYGTCAADTRGMVAVWWLLLAYLLHTTGELCVLPVGLSMVTKLSPARLVSTVMGGWFLATAGPQFLAGMIAQFTQVGDGEGARAFVPPPVKRRSMSTAESTASLPSPPELPPRYVSVLCRC